jgi:adenylate kinase family enzyme
VDRIAIIGCGGSGKSHLARTLGTRLGITPVHLDALCYDKNWNPLDQETFAALITDHAASAQVTVLHSRAVSRRYLAALTTASHPSSSVVAGHVDRV